MRRFGGLLALVALVTAACAGSDDRARPGTDQVAPCLPGEVPATFDGYGPGDLIGAVELDVPANLLTGARAWRVLYVSIGLDETDLVAVCGVVVAPADAPQIVAGDGNGKLVAWAHGTIGLLQACQPSTDPDTNVFGPTSGGIGAVAWGSLLQLDAAKGSARDGILQTLVDQGRVVAVTDYFTGLDDDAVLMRYVVGSQAGAQVIDSARAATELVRAELGVEPPTYDLAVWGHSQGGHAALWAGQIATPYLEATAPVRNASTSRVRLAGVAGAAPATSFVATPDDPESTWGTHLGDREMHQVQDVKILGVTVVRLALGPTLFSYVTASWAQLSRQAVAPEAEFPAYPPGDGDLDLAALLTGPDAGDGIGVSEDVSQQCLVGSDAFAIQRAVKPYLDPATSAFFTEPIWGEAGADGTFEGRLDETCRTTDDEALASWCRWLEWQQPGPAGSSPYPAVPRLDDGSLAPVFVAQGMADTVIHCISDGEGVPPPEDCLNRQYFDEMSGAYCPPGGDEGYLALRLWRKERRSPADHFSIPGQEADNGDLAFPGSPAEAFLSAVLDDPGSLTPGCSAEVVN